MIANHVGSRFPDHFGYVRLGVARGVDLTNAANAAATIAITEGTEYAVRQITVMNANATAATGNVAILTSSDGNASNAVSNNVVLSSVTGVHTYQDLGLVAGAATGTYTAGSLSVVVNTGVPATVDIAVFGTVTRR